MISIMTSSGECSSWISTKTGDVDQLVEELQELQCVENFLHAKGGMGSTSFADMLSIGKLALERLPPMACPALFIITDGCCSTENAFVYEGTLHSIMRDGIVVNVVDVDGHLVNAHGTRVEEPQNIASPYGFIEDPEFAQFFGKDFFERVSPLTPQRSNLRYLNLLLG